MNWIAASEKPALADAPGGMKEARNLLVWIAHRNYTGFVRGYYFELKPGDGDFHAEGFGGDWKITHWMQIERPA